MNEILVSCRIFTLRPLFIPELWFILVSLYTFRHHVFVRIDVVTYHRGVIFLL